jgi:hypothetical protein
LKGHQELLLKTLSQAFGELQRLSLNKKHLHKNYVRMLLGNYTMDLLISINNKPTRYKVILLNLLISTQKIDEMNIKKIVYDFRQKYLIKKTDLIFNSILYLCVDELSLYILKNLKHQPKEDKEESAGYFREAYNTFLVSIRSPLIQMLQLFCLKLGEELINVYIQEKVLTENIIKNKYKSRSVVELNTNELILNLNAKLPIISDRKNIKEVVTNIQRKTKIGDFNIRISRNEEKIQQKHYIKGFCIKKYEERNQAFCINITSSIQFFANLLASLENSSSSSSINFFSELFQFDFSQGIVGENSSFCKDLLSYCMNLNSFEDISYLIPKNIDAQAQTQFLKLCSRIRSYKIFFNEVFFNIRIMFHFKKFKFAWFFDSRGRTYPDASALNYYIPIVRSFLSFYNPLKLTDHHKYNVKKRSLILGLLKNQIKENMKIEPINLSLHELLSHQRTWSLGNIFYIKCLLEDFYGLISDDSYSLNHFIVWMLVAVAHRC